MQGTKEMVDKVNLELRAARTVTTLIGEADLSEFTQKYLKEFLGDAASVVESHIDAAHEGLRQWAEGNVRAFE